MLTKKDRKIRNQEAMIENRNVLIADMERQANALYEENKDLRCENEEQKELINRIEKLATSNTYSNDKAILNKIKDLTRNYQTK